MPSTATNSSIKIYPFGMVMPGRSYTANSGYRFGYQGSLKDEEITVAGSTYSTFFRELDTRDGRWYSLDPKGKAYESPYVSMGDNPISFNDPFGDVFDVGTDQGSKNDIKGLVKDKNQDFLKISDNGRVTLDFKGLSQDKVDKVLKKDKGLALINDLVNAKSKDGKDLNFYYSNSINGMQEVSSGNPKILNDNDPDFSHNKGEDAFNFKIDLDNGANSYETKKVYFANASTMDHGTNSSGEYGDIRAKNAEYRPKEGYDGQVTIYPGTAYTASIKKDDSYGAPHKLTFEFVMVPRKIMIMHELKENLLRTQDRLYYKEAHQKAIDLGYDYDKIVKFIFK